MYAGCLKMLPDTVIAEDFFYGPSWGPPLTKAAAYQTDAGTSLTVASQADCCTACTSTAGCLMFTWTEASGTCVLGTKRDGEVAGSPAPLTGEQYFSYSPAEIFLFAGRDPVPGTNTGFPTKGEPRGAGSGGQ